MTTNDEFNLRYPIGKFQFPSNVSDLQRLEWISDILKFPQQLRSLLQGLSEAQLQQTYRPGSWSVKQVVHHCADSHMNSFIRFKLALTEENPTIRPYYEDRWAQLPDGKSNDLTASLLLLDGLHIKWVGLLEGLSEAQLQRTFVHPEHGVEISLLENLATYSWHGRHHLAHIRMAVDGMK